MTSPLISILVPMYNHADYIERSLRSAVDQDYRPVEIIAIDDGSRDATAEVARRFLSSHAPSALLICRENRGAAQTINQAMSLANGDYFNILNSDDFFALNRISRCVDTAQRLNKELIFTGVRFVDDAGAVAPDDDYIVSLRSAQQAVTSHPTIGFALMRNQLAISTGNLFFSRALARQVGPFHSYRYVHDWDYILRCLFYVEPYFISEELYNYRLHGHNSFKTLAHIEGYETTEVMRNFLWSMTARFPNNSRAPSPFYWPSVFEQYIRKWNYHVYLPPRMRRELQNGEWLS